MIQDDTMSHLIIDLVIALAAIMVFLVILFKMRLASLLS